jgi:ABC-2 type transport system permease protein
VRVLYNSELKSKNFIVPGLIAVILMIISALLTSLTIAREWETGTMEQLLSTPVRPAELLLGKLCAYFVVGLADLALALAIGVGVFGVPLRGNVVLLISTSALFLFGALCWGIFISTIARSQQLAFQLGIVSSFLPAFLLSGFIFSIENMPFVIQQITRIVPARYFVTILQGVFLKGVGLRVLWGDVLFLIIYAVLVFTLASRKMRQKVA